jgi:uncharacterized protein with PIN domain
MPHRFILDGMLGSLARWLRIIGYDTIYYVDKEDDELRDEAKKNNRTLITRDHELYKKAVKNGIAAYILQSEKTTTQLKELADTLDLKMVPLNTRCPKCNSVLNHVEKEAVKERVPKASLKAFNEFWQCKKCKAVYWRGSHWIQIVKTLNNIKS